MSSLFKVSHLDVQECQQMKDSEFTFYDCYISN